MIFVIAAGADQQKNFQKVLIVTPFYSTITITTTTTATNSWAAKKVIKKNEKNKFCLYTRNVQVWVWMLTKSI